MVPPPMATAAQAQKMIDLMMSTRDPLKQGRGMAHVINSIDLPYNNRERAYQILRIGSVYSNKNAPLLNWRQFQTHVNKLLRIISPRGTKGERRRNCIKATRKVIRAFKTVTGARLVRPGDAGAIEQETTQLRVTPQTRPLSRIGQPASVLIYGGQPPMDYQASSQHLFGVSLRKERNEARRVGNGEKPSAHDVGAAEQQRHGQLWKYQATHKFIGAVRSGRGQSGRAAWLHDSVELSAVTTPLDATSLWAALSYCVSGHFEHAMSIKASVYMFFYEVINKGVGDVCRHSRHRLYQHLQRSSMSGFTQTETKDWGQMSLFRSLAVNDPGAGPPGYTRCEEIFWVLADFFGTEVVVFTARKAGRGGLDPSDGYNVYDARVYGQSPGLRGWPCRPGPLQGTLHHPLTRRFFNARHQLLLVTDTEDRGYVMPVRNAPMADGPNAGDDPVINTSHYGDEDRWFRWGPPEQPLLRPPNVWLLHSPAAAAANPAAPADTGGFSSWLPASDLDVPRAASVRWAAAKQAQPQEDWPAPEETWTMFEAGFDAPQMARALEPDVVMDGWRTWTDVPGAVVVPLAAERFMIRDGQRVLRRFQHDAQARLLQGARQAYVEGWDIPDDSLNGAIGLRMRDDEGLWLPEADDVLGRP